MGFKIIKLSDYLQQDESQQFPSQWFLSQWSIPQHSVCLTQSLWVSQHDELFNDPQLNKPIDNITTNNFFIIYNVYYKYNTKIKKGIS